MNPKISKLLANLNNQLSFMNLEIDNPSIRCEHAIRIILKTIDTLKVLISKTKFRTESEEIKFFKKTKPQFTSKLIFYNALYKIEMKRPNGGNRIVKKYYNKELIKLKAFFDNELEFYKYFRSGSTYLDHKYFLRGKFDIKMSLDSYYFETDRNFATSHDFKIANILANDLIQLHLENQLVLIDNKDFTEKSQINPKVKQIWTGSKSALIELLYALYSEGVFNNGASNLKDIASYFEDVFNIDLGNYYHTFVEIKSRKSNNTKFLDKLKESLVKRYEESDE